MARRGSGRDLTGIKFGRLTAVKYVRGDRDIMWLCRCECGAEPYVITGSLTAGKTRSCGCLPRSKETKPRNIKTHGEARHGAMTRTYRIWRKMRARCNNPRQKGFERYGGRGINVCARWDSFAQFRQDMGDCPDSMEIERVDNDGDYNPANCRWATRKEQTRNTSANRRLTLNGVTKCVTEWAETLGIERGTIFARLSYGWPEERVLTEPVNHRKGHR